MWDDYLEMISPWAAAVPFLVNPGNHEYDYTRDDWPSRGMVGMLTLNTSPTCTGVQTRAASAASRRNAYSLWAFRTHTGKQYPHPGRGSHRSGRSRWYL